MVRLGGHYLRALFIGWRVDDDVVASVEGFVQTPALCVGILCARLASLPALEDHFHIRVVGELLSQARISSNFGAVNDDQLHCTGLTLWPMDSKTNAM
jgi:hypothetical protein